MRPKRVYTDYLQDIAYYAQKAREFVEGLRFE